MTDVNSPIKHRLMPIPQVEKIKLEIAEKDKDPRLQKFLKYSLERKKKRRTDELNIERAYAAYKRTQTKIGTVPITKEPPFVPNFMVSEELKLAKSYKVMKSCIEKSIIPQIQGDWLQNILAKTPENLKSGRESKISEVLLEVREHYLQSLKNALTSQTLRNLNLPQIVKDDLLLLKEASGKTNFPRPWHLDYVKNKKRLASRLMITHQHMQKILSLCNDELRNTELTVVSRYRELGAIDFGELRTLIQKEIDTKCEYLMHNWYPKVVRLFSGKTSMPNLKMNGFELFFNCASTLMSIQLKEFLQQNLLRWVEIFEEDCKEYLPVLKMYLTYEDQRVLFYPSYEDLEELVFSVAGLICNSLQDIQKVQSWLNSSPVPEYIDAKIPPEVYKICKQKLQNAVKRYFEVPYDYFTKTFVESYSFIYDGREARKVEEFLKSDKQFKQYCEYITNLHNLANQVMDLPITQYFDLIQLDCGDVKAGLYKECHRLANLLLDRVVSDFTQNNDEICSTFEEIRGRCHTVPQNSEELIDMIQYMEEARCQGMIRMTEKISLTMEYLNYLLDVYSFSPEEIARNSVVLTWKTRIIPEFDANDKLQERMRAVGEAAVTARREKLITELNRLKKRVDEFNDYGEMDAEMQDQYVQDVRAVLKRLQDAENEKIWINKEEDLYKLTISSYPELEEIKNLVEPFHRLFTTVVKYSKSERRWLHGEFDKLNAEAIEAEVDEYWRELYKLQKIFTAKVKKMNMELDERKKSRKRRRRMASVDTNTTVTDVESKEDVISTVEQEDDEIDEVKPLAVLDVIKNVQDQIKQFKENIPVIAILCNPGIRKRHWDAMSQIAGKDLTPDSGTSLAKMLQLNLDPFMEQFASISSGASKEFTLETNMNKMHDDWTEISFNLIAYRETGIFILASVDDIQQMLDDQIVKTQTMRGSPFIKPFEVEIKAWEERLLHIQETLDEWLKMQAQWLYLDPIFSSEDIMQQMPEEGRLFQVVNRNFKDIMKNTAKDPNVLKATDFLGILEKIKDSNGLLEKINKGLNAYLEKKRLYFARFFFLSNDEMLEILSETKDPLRVQPHLKKCFEGIAKLEFDDRLDIKAMFSSEGEKVQLSQSISTSEARGSVEKWLLQVEKVMLMSIRDVIAAAREAYEKEIRELWVCQWPGQVVLCVSQIFWTLEVHESLSYGIKGLENYYEKLDKQMSAIVKLVRGKLNAQQRITLGALVVIDVHARDVVHDMIKLNVTSENDFNWLSQLRYYWENENVMVRLTNAKVSYAYEYLGNSPRLVITPLTDRCYRTLIGAYHLNLNGAPEGPAGTGKTETTKDLAKALAVQCVVFNCSDGLDYIAMGKFFKGLASSGAWACFDEFNRIELEVLSVIAQQILCIIRAIQSRLQVFVFEGTELNLNPNCYVCITMNPGYAGRSELPDNLKVLFRPVAMMVPDYAMIGEISLYSYGFMDARSLSVKIVTTYRLCSEQLSSQAHYDYGMRAVKAVLQAAGNLKLKYPDENENIILLRSIIDVNLPKFLSHDIPLFRGIISDLFPGIVLPDADYSIFLAEVHKVCQERNIQAVNFFTEKIIQTYEMMIVRHGFMLVGEPFGSKTTVLHTLATVMTRLNENGHDEYEKVIYKTINPKAITMGQLFGEFDPVSHEWTDGVTANTFREFASNDTPDRKWVIFDGPIDTLWIESMNTVLDDNKKLCLMSGEIIQMSRVMSLIFETMDLSQASPATVSRCGMIYMEPLSLGWRPLFHSWMNRLPTTLTAADCKDMINSFFEWAVDPCIEFVLNDCRTIVAISQGNLVSSCLGFIDMLIEDVASEEDASENRYLRLWLQTSIVFGIVWGIGGCLDYNSRQKFDRFLRNLLSGLNEKHPLPKELGQKLDFPFPESGLVYDYYYKMKSRGSWRHWNEKNRTDDQFSERKIREIIVPTMDTARYKYIVDLCMKKHRPLLYVGPTGTGKSVYVQEKLMREIDKEKFVAYFINFSAQTSSNQTQSIIMSKIDRRRKGVYGPLMGKTAVLFVDDLNMPNKEIYGAQPPIELLRMLIDHGYWYDLKDTTKLVLQDIHLIGAMGPPGGGRNDITQRFMRHFHVISMTPFNDETMTRIFSTLMNIYFRSQEFSSEYITIGQMIVSSTLEVYKAAIENLLPTPAKSHYLFNLRDFSRVILGVCLIQKDRVESKQTFSRLWAHEVMRVFYDRLTDDTDRTWLYEFIKHCLQNNFKEKFDQLFAHLALKEGEEIGETHLRSYVMFGDFMNPEAMPEDRVYEEIKDIQAVYPVVEHCLEDYNNANKKKMSLVIFRYVLEHLSRICRILRVPGGHALLVGVGGSGRQSLTRLASAMAGYTVFQPEISKNYGKNEWREDLKTLLRRAGAEGKNTVFLMTDSQIKEETFLEDIDSLLNSGEVPNLYSSEEKAELMDIIQNCLAASSGNKSVDLSPLGLYALFVDRCREKLHVVMAFSPIGEAFRNRLRQFPALINCCTIDWFQPWPEDGLVRVANRALQNLDVDEHIRDSTVHLFNYFHTSITPLSEKFLTNLGRKTYVTPTSYLELIDSFQRLLTQKQNEISKAKMRYINGLDKLAFAAEQVADMQIKLEELQPQLVLASEENEKLLTVIATESLTVEEQRVKVKAEEEIVNQKADASKSLSEECRADLAEAQPALEAALSALDTLKPADITIVKSMQNPPPGVKLVMEGVCVMRDIKPDKINDPSGSGKKINDYWGPSKKLLGDLNFLTMLKEYDKDNISPGIMQRIRKDFMTNPEFDPAKVARASSAAEGLCKWILAMEQYDRVAKIVAPKRIKLAEAESELADNMACLKKTQDALAEVEAKLKNLQDQLGSTQNEKKRLEDEVMNCATKLERATKLISGLGGEKDRWRQAADYLEKAYHNLTGDVLISAGIIAYLGPFTSVYREECILEWIIQCKKQNIPCSEPFTLTQCLGDPVKIQQWNINGLPRDAFSIDNGVIVANARRWPLMIDPQGQANKWVKNMEKDTGITVVKLTDSDFIRNLENSIQFGTPILLENVGEDLDPSLEPLLLKQTFKQGGVDMIRLGENVIEYSKDFRLYITTKLRNPHYLPEIAVKVSLLNFMITLEGLEDQLLGIVVAKEKPELEEARQELIITTANNKRMLKETEDRILATLSESEGNILENEAAIEILDSSKLISDDILKKQKVAEETQKKIDGVRMDYSPIAKHSAVLFFSLTDLPNIDPMYQYSLAWFVNLYVNSVHDSNKSKILERRLRYLKDHFEYNLYTNVCRSLFEKHKVLFAFSMCINIVKSRGELEMDEFMFFLTGGVGLENKLSNPASGWLSDKCWNEICRMTTLKGFETFREHFTTHLNEWKQYYDSKDPQEARLPEPWDKLDVFKGLIILRCIRPDKVVPGVMNYVREKLGRKFVEPLPFDLAKSYQDSSCITPLIFILSPGADPTMALLKFATDKGFGGSRFQSISLGQGQGPIAAKMIAQGKQDGSWILLQNCHLAVSWMTALEKICEDMTTENTNSSFRLWLTSYPSPKFPVTVLQNGIKMTNEPPTGLRQNLLQSYLNDPISDPEFFKACPNKEAVFEKLVFGLCFFHALIQERIKFGPLGWNIPYGFNESDLRISVRQLQMFVNEYEKYTGIFSLILSVSSNIHHIPVSLVNIATVIQVAFSDTRYKFSPSGLYYAPPKMDYSEYLEFIKSLPATQTPEVFGMHENVDITRELSETRTLFDSILLTVGQTSSEGGGLSDSRIDAIANDILEKLPNAYDISNAYKKYPVKYEESMNTVLVQEMERFNNLTGIIKATLNDLRKAIKGLAIMSDSLESLATALSIGKLPALWALLSVYNNHMKEWFVNDKPSTYWVSGFFFTQAFLTGVLQNYARRTKIPIDLLAFDFEVRATHNETKPPADGAYIHGLFLDGCRWDYESMELGEQYPKILNDPMPIIWLKPILREELDDLSSKLIRYSCPVYKTSERRGTLSTTGHSTNFVLPILLSTSVNPSHWIKRGAALLCQLDD
ncbi:Dynein heavy chain 7, axonemal [Schistosoma japonicum]|nr:Dynein heavy chain 7, axonemal [Schistosoma japonicum]